MKVDRPSRGRFAGSERAAGEAYSAIDLFSGCGGLTAGLKRAGFRVLGAIDVEPLAVETYRMNHPEVRLWRRDIRWLPARRVMTELGLEPGQLDLLAGCPPCQGFSRLRTLNGARVIRDSRNRLILEFLRYVSVLRPRAVIFENVPGLARRDVFRQFLHGLTRLGYTVQHRIIDAADFGVPQRRLRLVLFATDGGTIAFPRPSRFRRSVRGAIARLPRAGRSGDALHDLPEQRLPHIVRLIARIREDGGSMADLGQRSRLKCHQRCDGFFDVYGRMRWNDVAPTITSGCVNPSKGRFLHPRHNRCITPREAALLQTFPPDYRFSLKRGKYAVAELVGNAFPPELARRHGLVVARSLGGATG